MRLHLRERPGTNVAPFPLRQRRPPAAGDVLPSALSRPLKRAQQIEPGRLARLDAAVIAGLGVMGALEFFTSARLGLFNLDAEGSVPAAFSGALLFCAASLALIIAQGADWGRGRQALLLMTGFFAFMGIDEVFTIHEHIGGVLRIPWQIPYLPLAAAGGLIWFSVLRLLSADRTALKLWIAGAAAWVGSQAFEALQTAVAPDGYRSTHGAFTLHGALAIPEETGEMIGSSLFLFALLLFLRARLTAGPRTGARPSPKRS